MTDLRENPICEECGRRHPPLEYCYHYSFMEEFERPLKKFYILPRGEHTMVKTEAYFLEQHGKSMEWGTDWLLVEARSIEEARMRG